MARDPLALYALAQSVSGGSISKVTSFPGSPTDGQVVALPADTSSFTTCTIIWTFIYNASSSSSFKWYSFGYNPPITAEVLTAESTSSTSFVDLATVGPSITLPAFIAVGGDFDLAWEADMQATNQWAGQIAPKIGSAAVDSNNVTNASDSPGGNAWAGHETVRSSRTITNIAAGTVIKLQYDVNSASSAAVTFQRRRLSLMPRRVA